MRIGRMNISHGDRPMQDTGSGRMLAGLLLVIFTSNFISPVFCSAAEPKSTSSKNANSNSSNPKSTPPKNAPAPSAEQKIAQTEAGSSPATRRTGEDWPEFLGPRGTGISGETGLISKWGDDGPTRVFRKRLGNGYTAPSILGNLLVVFHRQADSNIVEALEADTGKSLWKHTYNTEFSDPYGYSNGPRCAPLLRGNRCYTWGPEGKLFCQALDTGKVIWQRDTATDFDVPEAFFGVGSTPILDGNRLICMVGGLPDAGLVAFDAETGKTLWQSVSLKTFTPPEGFRYARDDKLASYSTPLIATIHGQSHLLAFMRPGLVSVDPQTGKVRFSFFFRAPVRESVNAARPIVVDDLIFLSAAYDTGAAVLKVQPDGNGYDVVWRDEEAMQNHWSTSLYHDGLLYGFSGRHEIPSMLKCIELNTGKLRWATEDVFPLQISPARAADRPELNYYGRGSSILADGKMFVLSEWGHLALLELNPRKCVELARHRVPEFQYPVWPAPVLSRKRIYLRDERYLISYDLHPAANTP